MYTTTSLLLWLKIKEDLLDAEGHKIGTFATDEQFGDESLNCWVLHLHMTIFQDMKKDYRKVLIRKMASFEIVTFPGNTF